MAKQVIELELIRGKAAYRRALARLAHFFDHAPATNSPEETEFEILMLMAERHEREHHALPSPDPVAAIRFAIEQRGFGPAELNALLGSRQRAHEILNRKRRLTLSQIRELHDKLGIPADVLIQDY